MAKVVINVLSASGEDWGPMVLRSTVTEPTTERMYRCLESLYHEVGSLTDETGRYFGPGEDCVLRPGKYTFRLAGNLGTSVGGRCSMDALLRSPLPEPGSTCTSAPMVDQVHHQSTHPTLVKKWPGWQAELKAMFGNLPESWQATKYKRKEETITGKDGAAALLQATACQRINTLFATTNFNCSFGIHPSRRPSEGPDREQHGTGVQIEAEEEVQGCPPDICLMALTGILRNIHQTTICKAGCQLVNMHDMSMPEIWNAVKSGHPVPDADAAEYVVNAIAQELGHMSRRGHKTGTITSYHTTWLLKTDGKGCVWISDPVAYDCQGTDTTASVTEVLLFSALYNLRDVYSKPYPAATAPGRPPVSSQAFNAGRKRAQAALVPRRRGRMEVSSGPISSSGGNTLRSGTLYQKPASLAFGALHLTTRLAPCVFLGSVYGTVAAVRLATNEAAIEKAMQEAKVYEHLKDLQGQYVPRLLEHGPTLEGKAYFVATEFMEGSAWRWNAPSHRALKPKLKAALERIHAAGVLHGDLHEGNILVTPDKRVFVLDFAASLLNPSDKLVKSEMKDIGFRGCC